MHRAAVVLPLPDSPTSPTLSLWAMSKLTSSTARVTTGARQKRRRTNCFPSRRTSRSGCDATSLPLGIGCVRGGCPRGGTIQMAEGGHVDRWRPRRWRQALTRVEPLGASWRERTAGPEEPRRSSVTPCQARRPEPRRAAPGVVCAPCPASRACACGHRAASPLRAPAAFP